MTPIRIALITTLALLTGLWILAEYLAPGSYRSLHPFFTQYTGAMGLAMMSLALVLATRPKWLERPLHGLDKMYRLHKWLGITGLVFMLAHWWWTPGEQLRLRRGGLRLRRKESRHGFRDRKPLRNPLACGPSTRSLC